MGASLARARALRRRERVWYLACFAGALPALQEVPTLAEAARSPQCPNCGNEVVVPKSTKAFICKHCDALLKAAQTESGYELKLLGKSVDDNGEYQALTDEVARLRIEIQDLHAKYELEAIRSYGKAPGRMRALAIVLLVAAGLVWLFGMPQAASWTAIAAAVALVLSWVLRRGQNKARQTRLQELGRELEEMARRRDDLDARAARIRVTSA